jgi:hypothetical protein
MEDAEVVEVFDFLEFDPASGEMRWVNFKAMRVAIETRFRGKVLEGTGRRVLRSELDAEGRFRRIATGWGVLPP